MLTRAHAGPETTEAKPRKRTRRDRQVAAHTKAAPPVPTPPLSAGSEPSLAEDDEPLAEVIPLGLFDPLEDPWRHK
ncbi:hypothetical protein OG762_50185 (plasmid) [Streptomyces sp. NBC_01136]|uniref:hypothetical protein n=1 Tax=unclassified Streptomyces TaxID=2593676 RepID=UPI002F90EA3C|nr:hypothetical protein OG762_50185 [Streptomyces sp. NBC_01136]